MKKRQVECKDIVKTYSDGPKAVTVLRGINQKFESGKIYVIFGPSGSGKTTFLSLLGGILRPSSGKIILEDEWEISRNTENMYEYRTENISYVFQEPIFTPFLNVVENIKFVSKNIAKNSDKKEVINDERLMSILKLTKLDHRKEALPYQLSGGEKQRLSIAIALSLNNSLWLCDEPTGTLDSENKMTIMNLLKEVMREDPSKIMILVTHDPSFQKIADEILILRDGKFNLHLTKDEFNKLEKTSIMYDSLDEKLNDDLKKKEILNQIEKLKKSIFD